MSTVIRPKLERSVLALLLMSALWLASCGSQIDFDEPPEILYGEQACDRCLMIISEARFAAAYVTVDGETRRFDDIGGMLDYDKEQGEEVAVFWVHDYETEEWLKAGDATYVMNDELITPMGFGIIAFETRDRAMAWSSEEGGMVMNFEDLKAAASHGEMEAGHDHEHEDQVNPGEDQGGGG